jgi:hypothetical protein
MERSQLFDLMGELKLFGMKAAHPPDRHAARRGSQMHGRTPLPARHRFAHPQLRTTRRTRSGHGVRDTLSLCVGPVGPRPALHRSVDIRYARDPARL